MADTKLVMTLRPFDPVTSLASFIKSMGTDDITGRKTENINISMDEVGFTSSETKNPHCICFIRIRIAIRRGSRIDRLKMNNFIKRTSFDLMLCLVEGLGGGSQLLSDGR